MLFTDVDHNYIDKQWSVKNTEALVSFPKSVCVLYIRKSHFNAKFEVFLAVKPLPKDAEERLNTIQVTSQWCQKSPKKWTVFAGYTTWNNGHHNLKPLFSKEYNLGFSHFLLFGVTVTWQWRDTDTSSIAHSLFVERKLLVIWNHLWSYKIYFRAKFFALNSNSTLFLPIL